MAVIALSESAYIFGAVFDIPKDLVFDCTNNIGRIARPCDDRTGRRELRQKRQVKIRERVGALS